MMNQRDIRRLKKRLAEPGMVLMVEFYDHATTEADTWNEDVEVDCPLCPAIGLLAEPFNGKDLKLCGVYDGKSYLKWAIHISAVALIRRLDFVEDIYT